MSAWPRHPRRLPLAATTRTHTHSWGCSVTQWDEARGGGEGKQCSDGCWRVDKGRDDHE